MKILPEKIKPIFKYFEPTYAFFLNSRYPENDLFFDKVINALNPLQKYKYLPTIYANRLALFNYSGYCLKCSS